MCYGQILEDGLRKARKQHVCDWCGEPIEPKTKYFFRVLVYEELDHSKYHSECAAAMAGAIPDDECFYFDPGTQPRGGFDEDRL